MLHFSFSEVDSVSQSTKFVNDSDFRNFFGFRDTGLTKSSSDDREESFNCHLFFNLLTLSLLASLDVCDSGVRVRGGDVDDVGDVDELLDGAACPHGVRSIFYLFYLLCLNVTHCCLLLQYTHTYTHTQD